MIPVTVKTAQRPPSAEKIVKQIIYGTAVGFTKTAKEGQAAVHGSLKGTFTLRGRWSEQGNRFGIKIKPAKPVDLSAEIRTQADWLEKQKKGGQVTGSSRVRKFHYEYAGVRYIAVPSRALRPKGSKKVIGKALWPSALRKKKGTFVIISRKKKVPILMTRFAPGKEGYEAMYILRRDIRIKPEDTFYKPIHKVVNRRLNSNVEREVAKALATMR